MKPSEARDIAGSLGTPSKMPGLSYGLPAGKQCPTGSKLIGVKGSTCYKCYANNRGFYAMPSVKGGQAKRLAGLYNPLWVEAMVTLINSSIDPNVPYFRWHDSGDIQDLNHLINIVEVARRCKAINFWLPTREASIVSYYMKLYGIVHPSNLTIRVSATMVDGKPSKVFKNTSTVVTKSEDATCPAPSQGNKCLTCRMCWDKRVPNVAYLKH